LFTTLRRPKLIADCRLPIADCRLPIADCRLPIAPAVAEATAGKDHRQNASLEIERPFAVCCFTFADSAFHW
jgi:hypothetical protein